MPICKCNILRRKAVRLIVSPKVPFVSTIPGVNDSVEDNHNAYEQHLRCSKDILQLAKLLHWNKIEQQYEWDENQDQNPSRHVWSEGQR